MKKGGIEELLYSETEKRLNEMESKDYVFPKKARKMDWMIIILSIVVCLTLIILCMVGVID